MAVYGLIAEFNPFHNGHKYLVEKIRSFEDFEGLVCVISGDFVQRGEPAVFNKKIRAEIACKYGCDLVLELPSMYCLSSAEVFARASVSILENIGFIDKLVFGSESGNIEELKKIYDILKSESHKTSLKKYIAKGFGYPKARELAFMDNDFINLSKVVNLSNNILSFEYLKALDTLNSSIKPSTIKIFKKEILHASNIRTMTLNKKDISSLVPKEIDLVNEKHFSDINRLFPFVSGVLRMKTPTDLKNINGISEGLENRLVKAAKISLNFNELILNISSKRYTYARAKRTVFNSCLGFELNDIKSNPLFSRILAFNKKGKSLLNKLTYKNDFILIGSNRELLNANENIKMQFNNSAKAADLFGLSLQKVRNAGTDFTESISLI